MVKVYAPFDAGAGANVLEAGWRDMMSGLALPTGVWVGKLNELAVTGDDSGQQVKVASGHASVEGHKFSSTAVETVSLAAAHATLPRIDRVVLRADFVGNTIDLAVLTGTAAGSPTVPALTQSSSVWEMALAQVAVAANDNSVAAGAVTDERHANFIWPHGVASKLYTPTWSGGSPSIGNGTLAGYWNNAPGKSISLAITFQSGSSTNYGSGSAAYQFSLPYGTALISQVLVGKLFDASASLNYDAIAAINAGQSIIALSLNASTNVTSTTPFTFATSDSILIGGNVKLT